MAFSAAAVAAAEPAVISLLRRSTTATEIARIRRLITLVLHNPEGENEENIEEEAEHEDHEGVEEEDIIEDENNELPPGDEENERNIILSLTTITCTDELTHDELSQLAAIIYDFNNNPLEPHFTVAAIKSVFSALLLRAPHLFWQHCLNIFDNNNEISQNVLLNTIFSEVGFLLNRAVDISFIRTLKRDIYLSRKLDMIAILAPYLSDNTVFKQWVEKLSKSICYTDSHSGDSEIKSLFKAILSLTPYVPDKKTLILWLKHIVKIYCSSQWETELNTTAAFMFYRSDTFMGNNPYFEAQLYFYKIIQLICQCIKTIAPNDLQEILTSLIHPLRTQQTIVVLHIGRHEYEIVETPLLLFYQAIAPFLSEPQAVIVIRHILQYQRPANIGAHYQDQINLTLALLCGVISYNRLNELIDDANLKTTLRIMLYISLHKTLIRTHENIPADWIENLTRIIQSDETGQETKAIAVAVSYALFDRCSEDNRAHLTALLEAHSPNIPINLLINSFTRESFLSRLRLQNPITYNRILLHFLQAETFNNIDDTVIQAFQQILPLLNAEQYEPLRIAFRQILNDHIIFFFPLENDAENLDLDTEFSNQDRLQKYLQLYNIFRAHAAWQPTPTFENFFRTQLGLTPEQLSAPSHPALHLSLFETIRFLRICQGNIIPINDTVRRTFFTVLTSNPATLTEPTIRHLMKLCQHRSALIASMACELSGRLLSRIHTEPETPALYLRIEESVYARIKRMAEENEIGEVNDLLKGPGDYITLLRAAIEGYSADREHPEDHLGNPAEKYLLTLFLTLTIYARKHQFDNKHYVETLREDAKSCWHFFSRKGHSTYEKYNAFLALQAIINRNELTLDAINNLRRTHLAFQHGELKALLNTLEHGLADAPQVRRVPVGFARLAALEAQ